MKSKKATRRALFSSLVSLLLCCSMLVGTTFAWFTDTVTSTGNIIKSGTLDVEMLWANEYAEDEADWTNASAGNIFDYQLWEPGFTQTKYVKVKNVGDLAFQYRMHIIPNVKPVAGEANLADVIDVYVAKVDNAYTGRSEALSAANKIGTLTELIANAEGTAYGALMPVGSQLTVPAELEEVTTVGEATFCITLHMQESAGNEYQNLTVGEGFAVRLLATQLNAEEDSFSADYDVNAVWPGELDTDWYTADPDAQEFTIGTAEELAGLAALVNGTTQAPEAVATYSLRGESAEPVVDSFTGKTIKLSGNIDLKHMNWAPIGTWDNAFEGEFDGQGHTISNLYINAPKLEGVGLFGVAQNATIKGIRVNNANITGYSMLGTIAGSPYSGCTISDCKVTGNIKLVAEWAYVGGIAGYGYMDVENCSVVANGTGVITSETRNAVGGITAWMLEGNNSIINCRVENLELTGWTNLGAITGFVHYSNVIEGCSAKNVTVTKTRVDGHPGIGLAAGGWNYNAKNAITIKNNNFEDITLNGNYVAVDSADILYGSEYYGNLNSNFVLENNTQKNITNNLVVVTAGKDAAALQSALNQGGNVVLSGDVNAEGAEGGYSKAGLTQTRGGMIDGNGSTLWVNNANDTWDCALYTTGGTIKNLTIGGAFRGIFTAGTSEDIIIDNVVIDDVCYTFNSDDGNSQYNVIITNSTLNGWTSYSNVHKRVTFENCTFGAGTGGYKYAFCRPYNASTFTNCVFEEGFEFDTTKANDLVFDNCYYGDTLITAENAATLASGDAVLFYNGVGNAQIK